MFWIQVPILLMEQFLHQLIDSLSHYLLGFIHPRWCRISSINNGTWKYPLGKGETSTNYHFWGSMSVFGGVCPKITNNNKNFTKHPSIECKQILHRQNLVVGWLPSHMAGSRHKSMTSSCFDKRPETQQQEWVICEYGPSNVFWFHEHMKVGTSPKDFF